MTIKRYGVEGGTGTGVSTYHFLAQQRQVVSYMYQVKRQ